MFDTKLIQVLRCLDNKALKKLYEFVETPFFTKSEKSIKLFMYIKPYLPKLESEALTKEKVFEALFPNTPYNNLRFNRICFEAMESVESFWRHYHLDETDVYLNKSLFDFYLQHDLDKHYDALYKSLENIHEKSAIRNLQYLFQKWMLSAANYAQKHAQQLRDEQASFNKLMTSLDDFYIAQKLENMSVNISMKAALNNENSSFLETEIVHYIETSGVTDLPAMIQILYYMFMIQKEPNNEHYFAEIFELNAKHGLTLNRIERLNIFTILQNFCIRQINQKDDNNYRKKLFDLYKQQLSEEFMYDINGNIAPSNFKNIVRLSLGLQEYDWAIHFIEDYSPKLNTDKRQDVESEARALYAFATGQYQETLKILQSIEPVDIFFKIDSKRLLIRAYYELQEYELALSTVNTFRVFVHRENAIHENHKITNRNFANLLTKLIQADKPAKIVKLQAELAETPNVADKKWLKEKIEQQLITPQT